MPRPRVLIQTDNLALAEIIRGDVARAGGAPSGDADGAPLAIVGGRTVEAIEQTVSQLPPDTEVIVIHTGLVGLGGQLDILGLPRVNNYIHEGTLDHALYPTVSKVLSGDIFGLDKYLPAAPTRRLRIDSYAGRGLALDAIMRAANTLGLPRVVREQMSTVTEELLINALYEAPVDETEERLFGAVGPRERLTLRSPQPVSLRYASTDQFFAIAVRDRFGRLSKQEVLQALANAHGEEVPSNSRVLGSGRGLHAVLARSTTVSFNVAAKMVSEVVCTFAREPHPHGAFGFFSHRAGEGSHA